MTLSIQTNQLNTRKKVKIDGHLYTVRRMGNIEQLNMAQFMRRLNKLAELEKQKALTPAQESEVDEITIKTMNMFVSLFDDGEDGSKAKALVSSLSNIEMGTILAQIFAEDNENGTETTS